MRAVHGMGFCLAAVMAVTGAAWAQDAAPAPADGGDRVKAMFDRLDTNHDGYISRDEAKAARDAMRQRMQDNRTAARDKAFSRLDANGDGSVSKSEFDSAPRVAGGGKPGAGGPRRGGPGGGGAGMISAMFDMIDTDHDGRISLAEAEAAAQQRMAMRGQRHGGTPGAPPAATGDRPLGAGRN